MSKHQDRCPGCLGFLLGAEIKLNVKDFRECLECPIFNKKECF
jgi:hypothetical protein